jgi:hypothetical protein
MKRCRMNCEVCGEWIKMDADGGYLEAVGEFWDPTHPEKESVIAHADCGIAKGYAVA